MGCTIREHTRSRSGGDARRHPPATQLWQARLANASPQARSQARKEAPSAARTD